MKIDIMSSIFGSKSVVEQCIDSWYPMPDKFTVNLYNNKKSNDDGTTNMLLEKNKIYNFHLTSEDINLRHADALNKLIEVTTGDWILILDSDAYLKNKNFYNWIDEATNRTDTLFWGTTRIYRPILQLGWNPRIPTYLMPRADSWIMLINRKFIKDYELKPNPLRVEGNLTEGKIFYKKFSDEISKGSNVKVRIFGDVGWQFYSVASQLGVYENIPDNILRCWNHVGHASCDRTKRLVL